MSLMSLFIKGGKSDKHVFTDDDRMFSADKRRQRADMQRMQFDIQMNEMQLRKLEQQARLEELQDKLGYFDGDNDEKEDNPDNMLMSLLPLLLQGKQQPPQAQQFTPQSIPAKVKLSDEEIDQYIEQVPSKYIKIARRMNIEQIKNIISAKLPNLDEETLTRAANKLKMG